MHRVLAYPQKAQLEVKLLGVVDSMEKIRERIPLGGLM